MQINSAMKFNPATGDDLARAAGICQRLQAIRAMEQIRSNPEVAEWANGQIAKLKAELKRMGVK